METKNYAYLKDNVKTTREAFALAETTVYPRIMLEKAQALMQMFSNYYFEKPEYRQRLIKDVETVPYTVLSFFELFQHMVDDALEMLEEFGTFHAALTNEQGD